MKKKGKVLLLIALIIGAIYLIYSFSYWGGATSSAGSDAETVGAGLATMLVMPHLVMTGLAVVFNALAFFMYSKPFALVAGILYSVALVLFPMYFMFVLIEMILCYVAFAKMPKKEK